MAQAPIEELMAARDGIVYSMTITGDGNSAQACIAGQPWVNSVVSHAQDTGTNLQLRVTDKKSHKRNYCVSHLQMRMQSSLNLGRKITQVPFKRFSFAESNSSLNKNRSTLSVGCFWEIDPPREFEPIFMPKQILFNFESPFLSWVQFGCNHVGNIVLIARIGRNTLFFFETLDRIDTIYRVNT